MVNRPVHFEVHVENPERAMAFYKALFGWTFQKYGSEGFDYWLVTTGPEGTPGINGGMMRRMGKVAGAKEPTPVIGYLCTMDVDNIDRAMKAAEQAGAVQAHPKNAVPTVGWTTYYKDPEGNIFGLFQADKNAR